MSLGQITHKGKTKEDQKVIDTLNQVILGNLNNTATITLTANAASTTVTNSRVAAGTFFSFMPTTANAAADLAAGTMYVSSRTKGSFVITHANNAQADRTFTYSHIG